MIDDEIHEDILWPELPYVTDEQGSEYATATLFKLIYPSFTWLSCMKKSMFSLFWHFADIYFQVNNDEDIIQTLASESNVLVCPFSPFSPRNLFGPNIQACTI